MKKNSAALIVIGDEILRGQVRDSNTPYLASKLCAIGMKLEKVAIIPDSVLDIATEISAVSKIYPIIFTSGGVGPTHDDVTYEAVAKCFALKLEENQELLDTYTKLIPNQPEVKRFCMVPTPCEVIHVKSTTDEFAVIKVQNVYVLPGSPRNFIPAINEIISGFEGGIPLYTDEIDLALSELRLVTKLDAIAESWKDRVKIGSYPILMGSELLTRITFEGIKEDVLKVKEQLIDLYPTHFAVDKKCILLSASQIVKAGRNQSHIARAWGIIHNCFARFRTNEVFLSFNGGKDCTAVLHLTAAFLAQNELGHLLSLYITGDSFPETDEFVSRAAVFYGFNVVRKSHPIKEAVTVFLKENPQIKGCLMGTRIGDPNAENLTPFWPSNSGWPKLIRVNPIHDWSYSDVWKFLLDFNVPYCPLYDEGYSSIGAATRTFKNPLLQDPNDPSKYLPAYTLSDNSTERQGRE